MTVQYPGYGLGWNVLGAALQQLGLAAEALEPLQKASALSPNDAQIHNNLGNAFSELGKQEDAITHLRRAIALDKKFAGAYINLGATFHDMSRYSEAEETYRKALKIAPELAEAHYNLGNTLKALGRLGEAEPCYRKALDIKPGLIGAHVNLGATLREMGKHEEAIQVFSKVLALRPTSVEAYNNLGITLNDMGLLSQAKDALEQALHINPKLSEIHNNLGNTLKNIGHLDQAIHCFKQSLALQPDNLSARSNLLFTLNYSAHATPDEYLREARLYGQIARNKAASPYTDWPHATAAADRLRIGLVSADLRNHPVGYFLQSVLSQLSSDTIELFAYPTTPKADELTARIKPYFSAWRPLYGKSGKDAAQLIHNDGINILIDLSGHTQHNRLPVFAWKPAPVQISWLGYFASTGVAEIDYILGDPWVTPLAEQSHLSEKIWQLPDTYWCFSSPDVSPDISPLPAQSSGQITFGCFNNLTKMNEGVVAVWAKILQAIPQSRLFLKYGQLHDPALREETLQRFARNGIAPDRLILEEASPRPEYFVSYNRVDIALDPFPYPGGTTSIEGMWMGVPVLTKRGDRFLSHAGETILHNAGLPGWIAVNEDDYVAKAVSFASDLNYLAHLRAGLREQLLQSPLFDATHFARNFGDAMQEMWARWLTQR